MSWEIYSPGDFKPLESLPHNVSRETKNQLKIFVTLVFEWNAKTNLTGAKSPQEFCLHHVLDCYFAWKVAVPFSDCLDIGSGAGLPGLVWGILSHQSNLFLVEANQKKAAFLQRVISKLGLKNIKVLPERFEKIAGDLITHCRQYPPKIVSRGTAAPKILWSKILASPVPFTEWLVFSSQRTHEEFLTLGKNSDMEVTSLPYTRDLEEEKSTGLLTKITPKG